MPKPLDERIAAAMSQDARIATVAELITEVGDEITKAQAEHDTLDALSKSATASEVDADGAADQASKLSRKMVRLDAKREQLKERHEVLLSSERRKTAEAAWQAASDERDQLATDLANRWPVLQAEMINLLARIKASDERIAKVNQQRTYGRANLESAENIVRERTGLGMHPKLTGLFMPSLKDIRLPRFYASEYDVAGTPAWPPQDPGENCLADLAGMFAQMEEAHRRRLQQA